MKKEIFIALDLEQPVKDSVIGVYETFELAQRGIEEYKSCKVVPPYYVRIKEHSLICKTDDYKNQEFDLEKLCSVIRNYAAVNFLDLSALIKVINQKF